jgi:DNA-binding transcriptional LysR family regulator
MNRLDALRVFVRVAEMASFTRAAESLGLTKASASTVLRRLEADIGARLLHRTTRRVTLTQDGQAFYERSKNLLADLDELQSLFQKDGGETLRGRLRVDMPSGMACEVVIPALPNLLQAHPGLELELGSSDRRVDLVQDGFDCVVRVGPLGDSSLVARPLGSLRQINCASPQYLHRHGVPQTLDDLAHGGHCVVHYVQALGAKPIGWEYPPGSGYAALAMPGAVQVNNVQAYEAACLAGLGMIQAPAVGLGLQRHLASGALVEVLPDLHAPPLPLSLVVAHRRGLSRRVRVFMGWLEGVLADYVAR